MSASARTPNNRFERNAPPARFACRLKRPRAARQASGARAGIAGIIVMTLIVSGCTTLTYSSHRSAETVSDCIAAGWRKVPSSGLELPVTVSKENDVYLVDVVLVRDFPTFLPVHSIWARVKPSAGGGTGSMTEYRRNFQLSHKRIDGVVRACQEGTAEAAVPNDSSKGDAAIGPRP